MPRPRPRLGPFVLLLALGLATTETTFGGDPVPPGVAASVPSDPAFVATLTDGSTVSGQVRQLGGAGVTLFGVGGPERADQERTIPLDRLVKLAREGGTPVRGVEGGLLVFPDGDRLLRCRIGTAGEATFDVHSSAVEGLAVPIDAVLGLAFEPPTDAESLEDVINRVRSEPRKSELLWLSNGDKLAGSFSGLDEKKVSFQSRGTKVDVERSAVLVLGFDPAQVNYPRPKAPYLDMTLTDGSRLGLTDVRLERGQVVGKARFGVEVHIPVGELAQVHAMGGPVAYLSDRDEAKSAYVPYIGPTRPYRRDLCVDGRPLRLGGKVYDRGLGMQSRTLLAYKLEPEAKRFQATVGLDDMAGPLGSVAFKVLVDGKARYESPAMAAGEPPRFVDVDLQGGKLLILITEFGERGEIQDHADWAEARIIR